MKIAKTAGALLLGCLLLHVPAYAKSPVWKISRSGSHLFVGGTIHVLSRSDYPLPAAFDRAYKNSAVLVLEADVQKMQTPDVQKKLLAKGMYTGEENLTDFLDPATVQELQAYVTARGMPAEQLFKCKPWLVSLTLLGFELQRLGLAGTGVDEFYCLKALNEKRPVRYLETAADQLEFLSHLGEGKENEFIQYTLQDLDDLPTVLQAIKDAWKNGDNARLQALAVDPLKKEFPKLYASIMVERNNNWVPLLEAMLKTKEIELVLVGSLHLVGDKGIIEQLKKRGYTVENI